MANNALLQRIAAGAQPRIADAMFRGARQGNALMEFQREQQKQNALAEMAQAYAQGGPEAAMRVAGQLGQFPQAVALGQQGYQRGRDTAADQFRQEGRTYSRGRDELADRLRGEDRTYRRGRDDVGDKRWQTTFDATQQHRQDTLNAAKNKPFSKIGQSWTDEQAGRVPKGTTQKLVDAIGKSGTNINVSTGQSPTKGWEAIDKKFAEGYLEFRRGGASDALKQMEQLDSVLADIDAGKPVSGPGVGLSGLAGDTAQAILNPDAVSAKERVAEVTQRNLRAILGGQFAKQEGDQLISRTFNPALPPQENARRVRALNAQMHQAYKAKAAMTSYFDKNGTLQGYQGPVPDPEVFRNLFRGDDQGQGDVNTADQLGNSYEDPIFKRYGK